MANQGRPRGTGRNTSFGKRQKADDDFRKKKKEGRTSSSSYSDRKKDGEGGERKRFSSSGPSRSGPSRSGPRSGPPRSGPPRRGPGGSSYAGGKRTFSAGPRDEKRSYRKDEGSSSDRGERKSYGRPERKSFDGGEKKPYGAGERKSFGGGEKRPYGRGERKSFEGGEKRSFGRAQSRSSEGGERKSFDKDDKKPFRKKSFEDKPEKRPRKKAFENRSFVESKVDSHRERVEKPEQTDGETAGDGLIRLNKFISNSGVCSRREADELIKLGVITVNGTTITEMGYKVKPTDDVRHEGKKLTAEQPVYILLNKPKGFITTTEDPQERNTVMGLIAGACKERVYPVGRLDRNTTGLLLLTNDGDLTDKLTHPSFQAKKIYKVELDKPLTKDDFQKILDGVHLDEGKALVDDLAIVSDDSKTVGIELHIGWNHVVRRIFDALEYSVIKLDRVVYAGLDKKDLKRGQWRFLKTDEIVRLKHFK
ncbi:MAG TPA: pseudouridine synthase [Cyclobacteriaceae bacterium]|nr:pseudouridine synthase [Cyclobacteriaceae bacterium]